MDSIGVYLARLIGAYGVEVVFGIPGVHTIELYRGLAESGLRHVAARHEGSLGFMADGYARASGRVAACFVITGPGLANIAAAMGQAYADSQPMLVVSAVNARGALGSGDGFLHEMRDQRAFSGAVAAFSHTVLAVDEIPQVVARAFAIFDGARPRPVHIEIPIDLLGASAAGLPPIPPRPPRLTRPRAAAATTEAAAKALGAAKRPLLLAGGGALDAAGPLAALAQRLDAPLAMSVNARGLLPPGHPLAVSASPSFEATRRLIAEADCVLAVGTELGPTDYDMYGRGGFAIPGALARLDVDAESLMRVRRPDLPLLGGAAETLPELAAALPARLASSRDGAARAARANAAGRAELSPAMARDVVMLEAIRDALPEAILVGDSTQVVYAGNLAFAAAQPRSWFNAATGFGALGFGLPAAIGAALAAPQRPVVCLAGDGGLQFTLAEFAAAVETRARLAVALINNRGYGEIKAAMIEAGVTPLGVDLHTPDFLAIAHAYGWRAERLAGREALAPALGAWRGEGGPILFEIVDEG